MSFMCSSLTLPSNSILQPLTFSPSCVCLFNYDVMQIKVVTKSTTSSQDSVAKAGKVHIQHNMNNSIIVWYNASAELGSHLIP